MGKKTLLISPVLSVVLLFFAAGACFAGTSELLLQADTYREQGQYEQAEAMYYSGFHAARKKSCSCGSDKWIMYKSKCGQWEQIEHVWDQLNGGAYGDKPDRFYKLFLDPE